MDRRYKRDVPPDGWVDPSDYGPENPMPGSKMPAKRVYTSLGYGTVLASVDGLACVKLDVGGMQLFSSDAVSDDAPPVADGPEIVEKQP